MKEKVLWEMIHEAVSKSENEIVGISEIRRYVEMNYPAKYNKIHSGTISAHAIYCCVNQQSRINFPGNDKPRSADTKYDFLYRIGRGQVTLYKPNVHGKWEIAKIDGKLVVRRVDGELGVSLTTNKQPKTEISAPKKRSKTKREDIPQPSVEQVKFYLDKWESLESYTAQESSLNKLFGVVYPTNKSLDDILIKVATLNDFYSTNIRSIFTVAQHIQNLDIDMRLQVGDETVVNDIANVTMTNGKMINKFSFATKYCSHHNAENYPIYDSYVKKLLCYLRDVDNFADFHEANLRNFPIFKQVILEFRKFYSLEDFTIKEIDKYLWQLGKEKFPNKYYSSKSKR